MRVKYAGFNLYGQCSNAKASIIDKFIDYPHGNDVQDVAIAFGEVFVQIGGEIFIERSGSLQKLDFPTVEVKVVEMSASESRVLFLDEQGKVYKLDLEDNREIEDISNVFRAENGCDTKITKISCGKCLSIALSENGTLFNLPNALRDFNGKGIVDIKTGREHCLILDRLGNVYSFGRGSRGQLGHSSLNDESEPRIIEALAGIKIAVIAAGGWHSCALSAEGDLYTWGWNSNGQLGNEALNVFATPNLVDIVTLSLEEQVEEPAIQMVACGSKHTTVLLDNGKLYGFGWNKYGQLGIEKEVGVDDILKPRLLCDTSEYKTDICNIICGPWSTAILIK